MEVTKRKIDELRDAMDNKAIDISADGQIYESLEGEVRYREIIHLEDLIEALEAS